MCNIHLFEKKYINMKSIFILNVIREKNEILKFNRYEIKIIWNGIIIHNNLHV